jgi:hypothetical protein
MDNFTRPSLFLKTWGKKETLIPTEYKAGWATETRFEKKMSKHCLAPVGETRLHSSVIQPVD